MKSIIIIGSGMGGLAAGIYGQRNGFVTTIFESHYQPGGQCTSWSRNGYVFDACIHFWGAGGSTSRIDAFWREVGAMPCEMVPTDECVSAVFPDGTWYHDYIDPDRLRKHLLELSPADAPVINEYLDGIRCLMKRNDPMGAMMMGPLREKLAAVPVFLRLMKYFRYTLGSFGARFQHPLLRKAFPLLHSSIPGFPLFLHLTKHAYLLEGDLAWPRGGSLALSKNMAARYGQLGGVILYRRKVVKILTENDRACGVELEDGTRHMSDFVISNADGRKTITQMLGGRYVDKRISRYCEPNGDGERPWSVIVFLGVKRDLASYPPALLLFLEKPEVIAGHTCEHLDLQIYGFDSSMAPAGKGVIKVELFARPSHFSRLSDDRAAYQAEKSRIAEQIIALLEKQFTRLREDIEVIDVATLRTWERFMGGTEGCDNFPRKTGGPDIASIMFGMYRNNSLPGLKNFYLAGGWVTAAGALLMNAMSGKAAVKKICRQCGVRFS
jgi:phytoene dehydrogenase-like protein